MQKFKSFLMKFGSTFAALALMVGIATSNSSCLMVFHQPKEPEAMNKFKFKKRESITFSLVEKGPDLPGLFCAFPFIK